AVQVLEEMQRGRATAVEERDVALLELEQLAARELGDQLCQPRFLPGGKKRRSVQYLPNFGQRVEQLLPRIGEQGAQCPEDLQVAAHVGVLVVVLPAP